MSTTPRKRAVTMLTIALAAFPHLRICQLIVNATNPPNNDPFYVTDEALAEALKNYVSIHGRKV